MIRPQTLGNIRNQNGVADIGIAGQASSPTVKSSSSLEFTRACPYRSSARLRRSCYAGRPCLVPLRGDLRSSKSSVCPADWSKYGLSIPLGTARTMTIRPFSRTTFLALAGYATDCRVVCLFEPIDASNIFLLKKFLKKCNRIKN